MIRLGRLLTILFVILEVLYCIQGGFRIWQAFQARNRTYSYSVNLAMLKAKYHENSLRLSYVRSDRFVEDVARQDLDWSKQNELIFMVSEKALGPVPSPY